MSSTNSPCAGCKFLRRKCTQECVFAPYFPPDQPQKFANVHKVFGASNVSKILNDLNPSQREDAVNSLAYEADARLRDPVYGCVGLISVLQHRLKQVQKDLHDAKIELASYAGPNVSFVPQIVNMQSSSVPVVPYNMQQRMMEGCTVQHAAAGDFYQQLQQPSPEQQSVDVVSGGGFDHLTGPGATSAGLSLGGGYVNDVYQVPQQPHNQVLLRQPRQQPPAAAQRTVEEDRGVASSC